MKEKNITKSLFNYKRTLILQATKDKEKTVKEIAESINEQPSRLYYHINQLEKLGLLKVAYEKLINNISQKYYIAANENLLPHQFILKDYMKNTNYIIPQLYALADKAISTIQSDLQSNKDITSEASIVRVKLTKEEWKEVNKKIMELISSRDQRERNSDLSNVNYIIMSYFDH